MIENKPAISVGALLLWRSSFKGIAVSLNCEKRTVALSSAPNAHPQDAVENEHLGSVDLSLKNVPHLAKCVCWVTLEPE